MSKCCLKNGKLCDVNGDEAVGILPTRILRFSSEGDIAEEREIPVLESGEGLLLYAGELYVEPLEMQIEYIKAQNAEKWLQGILKRHVDRVHQLDATLFVLTEMKEIDV